MKIHQDSSSLPLYYLGPDLKEGPLPAIFYFALSAKESLCVDPYNQPALFFQGQPVRLFSVDLPEHGEGLPAPSAIERWATRIQREPAFLEAFIQEMSHAIERLEKGGYLIPEKVAAMGLSRGAFIASLVAAQNPLVRYVLGFAPLTHLGFAKEFQNLSLPPFLSLQTQCDALADRKIRLYIGNRDLRVGTANCFRWMESLVEAAHRKKIRSAPIELIVGPSIGHLGHGTAKETFQQGATWLKQQLAAS